MDKNLENQLNNIIDNVNKSIDENRKFFIDNSCDKFLYPFIAFTGITDYPKIFIVMDEYNILIQVYIKLKDSSFDNIIVVDHFISNRVKIIHNENDQLLTFEDKITGEYLEFGYTKKIGWIYYPDLQEKNY